MRSLLWVCLLLLQASPGQPVASQNRLALLSDTDENARSSFAEAKTTSAASKRIAIIGTGITGATAAFTLAENGRLLPEGPPDITIFERNAIIGGRITTTQVFDNPGFTIDTCAATFSLASDFCLAQAATGVGLTTTPFTPTTSGVGIWDGETLQGLVEDQGFRDPRTWTLARKLRWLQRYGNAPWRYSDTVTTQLSPFQQLGRQLFSSLADEIRLQNLEKVVREGVCENRFLNCTDAKDELFLREVVAAGTRERFFNTYDQLTGLDSLLALETENVASIQGGNLRLIDRLIKLSGATVMLNTAVERLEQTRRTAWIVTPTRGQLSTYDCVIIATPLTISDITIESPLEAIRSPGLEQEYFDTFVTHFTTPKRLNATFFKARGPGPQSILTTNGTQNTSAPFFSLTLIDDSVVNPRTGGTENLYKIVSDLLLSNVELGEYIEQSESLTQPTITWINRQRLPQSVPRIARNQTILGEIEIAPNLYYAGGGEQVTATVEFGCRMGSNAARLILPAPSDQV